MSNAKNKAAKRKKLKESRQGPPQQDPKKTNAKLSHVNNVANLVFQNVGSLEQRVQENVKQIWQNEEELKAGMDAAEFNLRAHQKVLNAFAMEFENLLAHLNEEVFRTEHKLTVLDLADVTLPSDGEEPLVVRRLNWPGYHEEVERDIQLLAEMEAAKEAEEKEQLEKELQADSGLEEQMSALTGISAERLEAAAGTDWLETAKEEHEVLASLSLKVSDELQKKSAGEEYDQAIIEQAYQVLEAVALGEEKESVQPSSDIPEGAAVFGG